MMKMVLVKLTRRTIVRARKQRERETERET